MDGSADRRVRGTSNGRLGVPLSPCDVGRSLGAQTRSVEVAGRVFNVEGKLLVLADAFARVAIEMARGR